MCKLKRNDIRIQKRAEAKSMRLAARYSSSDQKRNEDILEECEIGPIENKLLQYREKWLNRIGKMEDISYQKQLDYRPIARKRFSKPLPSDQKR
jgi:hypothetical protein